MRGRGLLLLDRKSKTLPFADVVFPLFFYDLILGIFSFQLIKTQSGIVNVPISVVSVFVLLLSLVCFHVF